MACYNYKGADRVGLVNINFQGYEMKIIEYNTSRDIYVEFNDDSHSVVHTEWEKFRDGKTINWYLPTVYKRGIIENMRNEVPNMARTKEYSTWWSMFERCYKEENYKKRPTYSDCEVCEEWFYFRNFYNWVHSQENCKNWLSLERSAIDKDIIIKHNRIYSPDTCSLVPIDVNSLFIRQESERGKYPIGVSYNDDFDKYVVNLTNMDNKRIYWGCYDSPEEAFNVYKINKEKKIKAIAEREFRLGNITERCYNAMINYEVEITD